MKECNQSYHNNNNNGDSSSASMVLSDIISASRGTALATEMGSDDAVMSCAHTHTNPHKPLHGYVFTLQSSER